MTQKVFLEWENVDFTWENLNMLWEDVSILIEVGELIRRGGGPSEYVRGNPWDITKRNLGEEKTDKFIKIVCRINDLKYEEVVYPNPKIKVTTQHIEKVFYEAKKVGVKVNF
jgi:hypothetical protein